MGDEKRISVFCQRIELDKQKLLDNTLDKIEVDSFNLTEFWTQFETSVQSLSNEVTKIGFMCGKKPFPKREEVEGMMMELSQRYSEMRDLFLVLPEEVGSLVYKSAKDAVGTIMSSLLAVVKSLNDLSEAGAKERLTLTGTFWDACNAVDKLPRNNLQACIAAVEAEKSLVDDAVEELNQVKDSVPAENLNSDTKPKIAANEKTDESFQRVKNDSGTEAPINVNVAPEINKNVKAKKGLMHVYSSKVRFFKSRFKKMERAKMLAAKRRKLRMRRNLAAASNTNNGVCDNEISKSIEREVKPIRYRTITESDYVNLGHWVRVLKGWGMQLNASTLPLQFDEIVRSLQIVADKWTEFVNLGVFENLTADEIREKEYLLLRKLDDFKAMRGIIEKDSRVPDVLFANSNVRQEPPRTSNICNESEENVVSSTSDYTPPVITSEIGSIDPDADNFVTSSEPFTH